MSNKTRVVFTGDISFSKYFSEAVKTQEVLSPQIRSLLQQADAVVANVECPLTARPIHSSRKLNHSSDPAVGAFLRDHNIRYWDIANNHIMDCLADGLTDTLQCAADYQCTAFGAGRNLEEASKPVLLGEDVRVGILSLTIPWSFLIAGEDSPGALTWKHSSLIEKRILELRQAGADWIVLVVHGGDEFSDMPMPYVRDRYLDLLNHGADIIVGHHPHVVQNYEYVGKKLIVYSLGNFIFDTDYQRSFKHTDVGMLLEIHFDKVGFIMNHLPVMIDRMTQSVGIWTTPAIFCEINKEEYGWLWPMAAHRFNKVNNKKWMLTQKRFSRSTGFALLIHKISSYRHRSNWIILKGRLVYLLKGWKTSKLNNVCEYLQDTVD